MTISFTGAANVPAHDTTAPAAQAQPAAAPPKRKRELGLFDALPAAKRQRTSADTMFAPSKSATFLTTGGTIGSKTTNAQGGYAPSSDFGPAQLLAGLRLPPDLRLHSRQLFGDGIDSKDMTDEHWLGLLDTLCDDTSQSIVMTHGTDSMALTAFFLWLTLPRERLEGQSVNLTGAMLSSDHPSADGGRNIEDALSVAASDATGVFAVMDRAVLAPPWFDKRHTTAVDAMQPVNGAAAGVVAEGEVSIVAPPAPPVRSFDVRGIGALPNVAVVSAQPGTNPRHAIEQIRYLVDVQKVDGLVWQGTGGGTGNRAVMAELNRVAGRIPVVRASHPGSGHVDKDKHHEDSAHFMATSGRLPSASHARVLLQVAIAHERKRLPPDAALDIRKVTAAFDDYR